VPCLYDADDVILPNGLARRDLTWAQASLRQRDSIPPERKRDFEKMYLDLVKECVVPADGDYNVEAGYRIKEAIQKELSEAVSIPKPDPCAITEFAKLVGADSNEAQEVFPGLWIGNSNPAKVGWLEERGVDHVVRAYDGKGYHSCAERDRSYAERGIELCEVPLDDRKDQELRPFLAHAHAFIHRALLNRGEKGIGGVLVHCGAGISRSCAITASYIMAVLRCNYQRALAVVKAARPIVGPNAGFSRQLKEWEEVAMAGSALPKGEKLEAK